jgi:hypothetical protein
MDIYDNNTEYVASPGNANNLEPIGPYMKDQLLYSLLPYLPETKCRPLALRLRVFFSTICWSYHTQTASTGCTASLSSSISATAPKNRSSSVVLAHSTSWMSMNRVNDSPEVA